MLGSLIAYNADGAVVATNDQIVAHDALGGLVGLIDVVAVEAAGKPLRLRPDGSAGVWHVEGAVGSGTWPEWLGAAAHDFRVETVGSRRKRRIVALVHKTSGHRRERVAIEAAIQARVAKPAGLSAPMADAMPDGSPVPTVKSEPADIRDLVGGPSRPLRLNPDGSTALWVPPATGIEGSGHIPIVTDDRPSAKAAP